MMTIMVANDSHIRGNVLFLILIAVALFAALTFAISSASRTSAPTASTEQLKTDVAALLSYTANLRATVQRMGFTSGVAGDQLMYNNDVYKNRGGSILLAMPAAPANPNIYVFRSDGGGIAAQGFEPLGGDCGYSNCTTNGQTVYGHANFWNIKVPDVGTDLPDVVIAFRAISNAACREINRALDIKSGNILYLYVHAQGYQAAASVTAPNTALDPISRPDEPHARGRHEFCFNSVNPSGTGNASTQNIFVSVLWPR